MGEWVRKCMGCWVVLQVLWRQMPDEVATRMGIRCWSWSWSCCRSRTQLVIWCKQVQVLPETSTFPGAIFDVCVSLWFANFCICNSAPGPGVKSLNALHSTGKSYFKYIYLQEQRNDPVRECVWYGLGQL